MDQQTRRQLLEEYKKQKQSKIELERKKVAQPKSNLVRMEANQAKPLADHNDKQATSVSRPASKGIFMRADRVASDSAKPPVIPPNKSSSKSLIPTVNKTPKNHENNPQKPLIKSNNANPITLPKPSTVSVHVQTTPELILPYAIDILLSTPPLPQSNLPTLIKTSVTKFHALRKFKLITTIPGTGVILRQQHIKIPEIDLFKFQDALNAAQSGNRDCARAIFRILTGSKYSSLSRIAYGDRVGSNKKHGIVNEDYSKNLNVWLGWAWYEEQWQDYEAALDVYEAAEKNITDDEDVARLSDEFSLFLIRLAKMTSEKSEEIEVTQESVTTEKQHHVHFDTTYREIPRENDSDDELPVAPTLQSYIPDEDEEFEYLEKQYGVQFIKDVYPVSENPTPRPPQRSRRVSTPFARKMFKSEEDDDRECTPMDHKVLSGMSQLSLDTATTPSILKKAGVKKKQVGVRFADDEVGSSVTVLTPIRAKKKERDVLGADVVITPVRRSLRLFNDEDYVPSKAQVEDEVKVDRKESQAPDVKLKTLLEEHGYAYVPNKAIPLDPKAASQRRRSWHTSALQPIQEVKGDNHETDE